MGEDRVIDVNGMGDYSLAIAVKQVGALSETFIERHVNKLLPNRTVVIANRALDASGRYWSTDAPCLVLSEVQPQRFVRRGVERIGRKLRIVEVQDIKEKAIKQFLLQHNVGVLLGEYLDNTCTYMKIAKELGIAIWGHAHGYDVSSALNNSIWKRRYVDYNHASGVITMNHTSRERLISLGVLSNKVHVVPYGVDVPAEHLSKPPQSRMRCLAVGRMVGKKAPIYLLDAFRLALREHSSIYLDYVGEGELLPAARQFITAFKLEGHVRLHGGLSPDLVKELMQQADVFIQHSITDRDTGDEEGLPLAILEAMANGLAVVSTQHGGIPEAVADRETGLLVNEGDTREMAKCIAALAQDEEKRRNMGIAGWKRAKELFSWERERDALRQLLLV